jgi:hypothetical protein
MQNIYIQKGSINNIDDLHKISRQTFYETFSPAKTEANMQKYLEERSLLKNLLEKYWCGQRPPGKAENKP